MIVSGKLHRGCLVFLGFDLFADKALDALDEDDDRLKLLKNLSMVVELTHSAFLLHDDVMDQDQIRRGLPTFHHFVKDELQELALADRPKVGESVAICLGDLLIFWSNSLLSESLLMFDNHHSSQKLSQIYYQNMANTCWGQMDDVYLAKSGNEIRDEQVFHVYSFKTGHYSIANPLLLGAIVAGASDKQLSLLAEISQKLGVIFQIIDDQLNLFGDSKITGKPVGSDIRENKKTILHNWLHKSASSQDKQDMNKLFGNEFLDEQGVETVKQLLQKYGVIEEIGQLIDKLKDEVQISLSKLGLFSQQEALFLDFVKFLTVRKK